MGTFLMGMQTTAATLEISLEIYQKTKNKTTILPRQLLVICPNLLSTLLQGYLQICVHCCLFQQLEFSNRRNLDAQQPTSG